MAETKVTPEESAKKAGEKKTGKNDFFSKYKFWIIGLGAVLVVLFFIMKKSGGSNAAAQNTQAQQASQMGINPSTGYLYGSPADIAALGGSGSVTATPGPAGPAGPTGARGPAGAPGPAEAPFQKISFSQAQKVAGSKGSSNLFYGSGGNVVQGKYANNRNVQYYVRNP